MIVVLLAWIVLSLVLGVVIGKAIHRADRIPRCPDGRPYTAQMSVPVVVRDADAFVVRRGLRVA